MPLLAHAVNTGLGPFVDGLIHPLVSPDDLIAVIALSLLAALRGLRSARQAVLFLPASWFMASCLFSFEGNLWAVLSTLVTCLLGVVVAADAPIPTPMVAVLAMAVGVLHGGINSEGLLQAIGTSLTLLLLVAFFAGQTVLIQQGTPRIVARVVGSWIAAIGMLALGWIMRHQ